MPKPVSPLDAAMARILWKLARHYADMPAESEVGIAGVLAVDLTVAAICGAEALERAPGSCPYACSCPMCAAFDANVPGEEA